MAEKKPEKYEELYFQARDRALERLVEGRNFRAECLSGFEIGLCTGEGVPITSDRLDRIRSESNYAFGFVLGLLAKLEAVKGRHYAASWQKRGEIGILPNLLRKIDRLEVLLGSIPGEGESLTETLGDAAVYSAKWAVLRAELSPEEFMKWIASIVALGKTGGNPNK